MEYQHGHAALYNHIEETRELKEKTEEILTEHKVIYQGPFMGGEDFSYYLQKVPGTFFYVGGRNEEINAVYPHHHPKFDVDEEAIVTIRKVFLIALSVQNVIKES